jgi:hypothetical protein
VVARDGDSYCIGLCETCPRRVLSASIGDDLRAGFAQPKAVGDGAQAASDSGANVSGNNGGAINTRSD